MMIGIAATAILVVWYFSKRIFLSGVGKEIESFIINGVHTIRKDPFFYHSDGDLCYDYLKGLEDKYLN